MSVTNYTPEKCRYWVGKLDKAVYLVSENAIKDIRIDNGEAWINSISQSPIKIDCYSISLSEEESLDERYKFIHTLTFSVKGYANKDDFQDRYYVIVRDYDGTWWLVNPLFPCKVTYTYTLGYQQNHTDFTVGTASNHPVLKLNGMSDASSYQCQDYWLDGIDALWLNEKKYTVHSGNAVKYTNDGFKGIDYNKRSATFTESFDGENTRHSIEFDILFSEYKKSWHYNLLEFKDNLYAAVIKTETGKYALCGFSYGLQPSFKISADDTIQSSDKIQITLQDAHDVGDAIEFYDSIDYEYLSAKTWEYTSEYDGYECVEDGVAKYLLQKEIDALGNETGNYKALEGYANRFPTINVIGLFEDIVLFSNPYCVGYGVCTLDTSLSNLVFNETGSVTLYLICDSDWSIQSSAEHITVTPSSGLANTPYNIMVTNTQEPSSSAEISTLTLSYCYNKENVYSVMVREYDGCLTKGFKYWIDAPETLVTVPSKCCINRVIETTAVGVIITLYTNYFTVLVPQNTTRNNRVILLVVEYCDGSSQTVEIHQDSVFVEWREEGEHFCIYNNEYKYERMYSGYTPEEMVITDVTRNVFVEAGSQLCNGVLYRWVETGVEGCEGCDAGDYMYVSFWTSNASPYSGTSWYTLGECTPCVNFGEMSRIKGDCSGVGCSDTNGRKRSYLCLSDDLVTYDFTYNQSGTGEFDGLVNETDDGCVTQHNCCYNYESGVQSDFITPRKLSGFSQSLYQNSDSAQITVGGSVEFIPAFAFQGCRYLKTVVFGENVVAIASLAFYNGISTTASVENIIIYATTPPQIYGHSTFDSVSSDVKIFVPASSLADYKTANGWSNYQNNIYAIQ